MALCGLPGAATVDITRLLVAEFHTVSSVMGKFDVLISKVPTNTPKSPFCPGDVHVSKALRQEGAAARSVMEDGGTMSYCAQAVAPAERPDQFPAGSAVHTWK